MNRGDSGFCWPSYHCQRFDEIVNWHLKRADFSYLGVMLYDPAQHVLRLHTLETVAPGPLRPGAAYAVDAIPSGWVWQQQQPLVIGDLDQETRFPRALPAMRGAQG